MDPSTPPNYYEILQLQPFANPALVIAAYRILSKLYHPDTARDQADLGKFRLLQEAYEVLSDPKKRLDYDSELRLSIFSGQREAGFMAQGFGSSSYHYRPDPPVRDPLWESSAAGQPTYTPTEEELKFYQSLYETPSRGTRHKTLALIILYIFLMIGAMTLGLLGLFTLFNGEADSFSYGVLFLVGGVLCLILAQVEAYFS
jgi:curved DNA-binding protein CbpA